MKPVRLLDNPQFLQLSCKNLAPTFLEAVEQAQLDLTRVIDAISNLISAHQLNQQKPRFNCRLFVQDR